MKSNRRSVLIGLGALTVGGGAVFGTGAFSQVDADRTVTVTTAGDGSALLQFEVTTSYNGVTDGGTGDIIRLDFGDETGINKDATTTFDDVLTVTNNGNQEVNLAASDVPSELTFEVPDGDGGITDLSSGIDIPADSENSVDITAVIDLSDGATAPADTDITFTATTT